MLNEIKLPTLLTEKSNKNYLAFVSDNKKINDKEILELYKHLKDNKDKYLFINENSDFIDWKDLIKYIHFIKYTNNDDVINYFIDCKIIRGNFNFKLLFANSNSFMSLISQKSNEIINGIEVSDTVILI